LACALVNLRLGREPKARVVIVTNMNIMKMNDEKKKFNLNPNT
jgi:hypothetical protein